MTLSNVGKSAASTTFAAVEAVVLQTPYKTSPKAIKLLLLLPSYNFPTYPDIYITPLLRPIPPMYYSTAILVGRHSLLLKLFHLQ